MWDNSQNGYNTTWNNTGGGFSNNWGGTMDFGGNPTNFGSIFAGGMSGVGQAYINIPGVTISGKGNTSNWNNSAYYADNMSSLYNSISGVSANVFHSFNPFFGQNGPEPGGGGLMMMDGISDIFGIALANAKPQNKYLAYALGAVAIIATKGRATRGVLEAELAVEKAEMKTVYRVFGGDSRAQGFSWTSIDPSTVRDFRNLAGLPSGGASGVTNTAEFMIKGEVGVKDIIKARGALPLDGMVGGLPEYIIDPKSVNITGFSVLVP